MSFKKFKIFLVIVCLAFVATLSFQNITLLRERIAGVTSSQQEEKIRGVILPHHLLAKDLINETLTRISENNKYSLILLLGPNHFDPESNTMSTSEILDDVPLAQEQIALLLSEFGDIRNDELLVSGEHSIMDLLPFLSSSFPEAKILPIVMSNYFEPQDFEKKLKTLVKIIPDDTLVIASVDFSHNTIHLEAMDKNEESIEAIQTFDLETIYDFKDDHLDSPLAINSLLRLMQILGATDFEVWQNTHSTLITGNPTVLGTSYVIGVFR